MPHVLLLGFGLMLLLVAQATQVFAQEPGRQAYVMPISGVVDQVMQNYVRDGIAKAEREGAAAVVLQMDTPGGALDATREIIKSLLNSPVPVIVWVGPSGSRAASAGTFITMASHVATMAPGTNIGAATPIDSSGQDIGGDLANKIMEDTQALLRSISTQRNRNLDVGPFDRDGRPSPTRPRRQSLPAASTGWPTAWMRRSPSPTAAP